MNDCERGNRLIHMKSWANWTAEDGSVVCLTLNCYSLNGTKVEVGDKIQAALYELKNDDLKALTVEMVNRLDSYCMSVSRLSGFGFGEFMDRHQAEIPIAFISHAKFEDETKNRLELNLFFNEKLHNEPIGPFQDDSESGSYDSMDASHFYSERLRDFFDGH